MPGDNGNTLEKAIAHYGFAMSHLVRDKLRQTGREAEIQGLLEQGFRFLFTFAPEDGSGGYHGQVGAALFNPATRETLPILSLDLVEDVAPTPVGARVQ
jgi:hypothetical protein